jgi:hypothetical protein
MAQGANNNNNLPPNDPSGGAASRPPYEWRWANTNVLQRGRIVQGRVRVRQPILPPPRIESGNDATTSGGSRPIYRGSGMPPSPWQIPPAVERQNAFPPGARREDVFPGPSSASNPNEPHTNAH